MAIDGKRERYPLVQRLSCVLSVTLAFWHGCFWSQKGTIFGQLGWAATVHLCPRCQVTLVAAPRIEGSHVLPFMESFSAARLIRIKGIGRKGPTSAALPPVPVFRRQGPLPFSLNICLGWRSAPWMAAAVLERVAASAASHFLWREIRAGSGPITGMFTPTHLDRPSMCRKGWRDHVNRTRVSSLSKKTLRKCQTEGLSVWQVGQGHLENKEDNPNSLIIIPILPIIFDTGKNLKG